MDENYALSCLEADLDQFRSGLLKKGKNIYDVQVYESLLAIWRNISEKTRFEDYASVCIKFGFECLQEKREHLGSLLCFNNLLKRIESVEMSLDNNCENLLKIKALAHIGLIKAKLQIKLLNSDAFTKATEVLRDVLTTPQFSKVQHLDIILTAIDVYTSLLLFALTSSFTAHEIAPVLWICGYIETNPLLLDLRFLEQRTNLHFLACECLYQTGFDSDAEAFARRALSKLVEINCIQEASDEKLSFESASKLRRAIIKISAVIFRRAVSESRKRPKGFLRPKNKLDIQVVLPNPWPRTLTERYVTEMFDSPKSQFYAIMEALRPFVSTSRQSLAKISSPVDSECELFDVFSELFVAGIELLLR